MKTHTIITAAIIGGAMALCPSNIMAQTLGVEYCTEWQSDLRGNYDWLNLLKTTAQLPIARNLAFDMSTISTAKTAENTLIDDLQTYSNIEAGNIPLAFARMGLGLNLRQSEFFVGINNVNEEYFTSVLTSFFTNSSCGISPTISCNYDIANYPLAAWCLHYRQQISDMSFQTSLYPGRGYSRIFGHDNVFSLDIKRDGIFSISSIDYNRDGIYCVLGTALHYGVCISDEDGEQISTEATSPEKKFSASPWILAELTLPHQFGMHLHGSFSTVKQGCKGFAGVGLIHNGTRAQPGVAMNYAHFTYDHEYSIELTCRVPLPTDIGYIQPVVHIVDSRHQSAKCIAMLRLYLEYALP